MVLLLCGAMLALYFILCNARTLRRLPPGPISLRIVGSIFSLKYPLHRCFASLGKIYGPIIHLRGGVVDYIVINSIAIAREVLITHDLEFAYRPAEYFSYGFKDIALAPYGESWKNLKQITSRHLMSNTRLDGVTGIYELEMAKSIKAIQSSGDHAPVNLTDVVSFVVASLLHAFDWKNEGEIDLSERSSGTLSCMPASDLVAFASARLETSVYAC